MFRRHMAINTNPLNGNLQLTPHKNVMSSSKVDELTQRKCLEKVKRGEFS